MADILARLKLRTGTFAAWSSANPILAAGEPGYEVDTRTLRIGDGTTAFLSLQRIRTSDGFTATFQPINDNLTAFSTLSFAANKLPYGTGIGAFSLTDLTAEARTFLAAATKLAQRQSLGLADTATTPIAGSSNMTISPALIPNRSAVGAAILAVGGPARLVAFTASGTFVKADYGAYPDDHMVTIWGWGAGAGGRNNLNGEGGGGGEYIERRIRFADLPSSVPVIIGAGGAVNTAGGDTVVGSVLRARGAISAIGAGIAPGSPGTPSTGGGGSNGDTQPGTPPMFPQNYWSGGGGGRQGVNGGSTGFGGGGGAGPSGSLPGTSMFGGNGGAAGVAGVAPGGGGGANAPGARGGAGIWL